MNYKVKLYKKGAVIMNSEEEAKTHKQAAKQALAKCLLEINHVCVIGKSTKRYKVEKFNTKMTRIRDLPRAFKTTRKGSFCVMVMFGPIVEFHSYYYEKDRDAAYEKAVQTCTELESAASAKASPVQSDITASTVETSDSKSGLTEKKISNGFAMTAMIKDLETLTVTDKTSGKDRSDDSEKSVWKAGYRVSRSRRTTRTLWATVRLEGHDLSKYPSANKHMQAMNGKTIKVERVGIIGGTVLYRGEALYWNEKWLDFENIKATVLPTPVHTRADGITFIGEMQRTVGKTLRFFKCSSVGDHKRHWTTLGGYCYSQDWLTLEPIDNPQKDLKNVIREVSKSVAKKMMMGKWEDDKKSKFVIKQEYFASDAS